ncbi:MAG: DNA repair protein RadC [Candidatus Electrothrix sp. AU1_5]|nr:DNA repair protein RadC [Candidatus Electrothrix sp. AX1]MCI5182314.1 DNA repair protein RadC [Candidatus Electrothrix gigas]MCI5192632.1 DNA repair protein RadC [Candidatus Electrothrix gigas]
MKCVSSIGFGHKRPLTVTRKDPLGSSAGHRQRLRDKFQEKGIEALTDTEIIELLLTFGTPRSDCKQPARDALNKFGSLPQVLDTPLEELKKIKGMGPKNIFALAFVQGVARRYLRQRIQKKNYITSSKEVADYLIYALRGLQHEVFMVVYLDASHAVIKSEILSEGTINVNTVYPRELLKAALKYHAASLVVAHNHPSGSLKPSRQDEQLTRTLYLLCSFMNITLLDHLIIGAGETVYSFADHGLMTAVKNNCADLRSRLI